MCPYQGPGSDRICNQDVPSTLLTCFEEFVSSELLQLTIAWGVFAVAEICFLCIFSQVGIAYCVFGLSQPLLGISTSS